ncbi:hypothetical protein ON010_g560 [Phytophthora cinnamomi]|nr:hypothetical protein ON010_g560 [Phytophthora cinnamomi]
MPQYRTPKQRIIAVCTWDDPSRSRSTASFASSSRSTDPSESTIPVFASSSATSPLIDHRHVRAACRRDPEGHPSRSVRHSAGRYVSPRSGRALHPGGRGPQRVQAHRRRHCARRRDWILEHEPLRKLRQSRAERVHGDVVPVRVARPDLQSTGHGAVQYGVAVLRTLVLARAGRGGAYHPAVRLRRDARTRRDLPLLPRAPSRRAAPGRQRNARDRRTADTRDARHCVVGAAHTYPRSVHDPRIHRQRLHVRHLLPVLLDGADGIAHQELQARVLLFCARGHTASLPVNSSTMQIDQYIAYTAMRSLAAIHR